MVQLEEATYQEMLEKIEGGRKAEEELLLAKLELQWFREQLGLSKLKLYGASSEKEPPHGPDSLFFNEAEQLEEPNAPEPDVEPRPSRRAKRTGQREMLLEKFPVEDVFHTLPEDEQLCPECAGKLHQMGEEVRQQIKIIPPKFIVQKDHRAKYSCRKCEENAITTPVVTAPMPEPAFPGSLASSSAVAFIMYRKFVESVPLYRQEQGFKLSGFDLSRQTMANWMIAGAGWLEHIYKRMQTQMLQHDILHADETSVQVLKEDGRPAQSQSYMWLYRTGRDGPPMVLYDYQTTRASSHPRAFLKEFKGYLHVDGYAGYDNMPGVVLAGCWAHARRKFHEALSLLEPAERKKLGAPAATGLNFCDRLFEVERDLRDVTPEERKAGGEARSKPILEEFRTWLDDHSVKVLSKTQLGSAIRYCLKQWSKLTTFLTDGRLELDNNRSERSIKPFVIGRKNWLFSNTPRGARSSAVIYSIVETAKENGIDPLVYLCLLFDKLPNIDRQKAESLDTLMPWADTPQRCCKTPTSNRPETSN